MSIPLVQLEAKFIRLTENGHREVETIEEAQGIRFLCPVCFDRNRGPVGTHIVICWSRSRGVPDHVRPGPGRWTLHGTGIGDLHLEGDPVGGARSVELKGGCAWHGFINHGVAEGGF